MNGPRSTAQSSLRSTRSAIPSRRGLLPREAARVPIGRGLPQSSHSSVGHVIFPNPEIGGDAREVVLGYPYRSPEIGLVLLEYRNGIAAALDFLDLVYTEAIAAILADDSIH